MDKLREYSRILRKNLTPQESKLWNILRKRQFYGYRFLRQYIIAPYIVDFICREKKIIIEVDGGQHNEPSDLLYDKQRTDFLSNQGFKVIRFWNNDVDNNIEGVYTELEKIFNIQN